MIAAESIGVLIVEDDPTATLLARELLEEAQNFQLLHAERLAGALDLLASGKVDVVLLDLGLPDSQGLDTLVRLRANSPHVPIVVMTSRDDEDLAFRAVQAGAQDYLVKSLVHEEVLTRAIRYAIERKRVEGDLQRSERQYRLLFEDSPQPMWVYDTETLRFLAVNAAAVSAYGYSLEEFLSMTIADIRPPEDVPAMLEAVAKRNDLRRPEVWRHQRKDGSRIDVEITSHTIRFAEREGILVLANDVTERKRAEARLHLLERAVEAAREGVVITGEESQDFPILYANTAFEALTGYARDEILSKNCRFLQGAATEPDTVVDIRSALRDERPYAGELLNYRKDGTTFWNALSIAPIRDAKGTVTNFVGLQQDVTERRADAERQREREARLSRQNQVLLRLMSREREFFLDLEGAARTFTEMVADAVDVARTSVWLYTEDRTAIRAVDLYERTQGWHESGQSLEAAIYPRYFAALASGRPIAAGDARTDPRTCEFTESYLEPTGITSMLDAAVFLRGEVGGVVCIEHTGPPRVWTLDEQNFVASVAGLVSVVIEVAERARAEEELRESEERFRQLADAMPQIVWSARADGTIDYYNDQWYSFTGFDRDQDLAQMANLILHPDDVARRNAALADAIATGSAYELEFRLLDHSTGNYRWFLGRALPARNEAGDIVRWFGTTTDIDRIKRLEEFLRAEEFRIARAQGVVHFGNWELDVATGALNWSEEVFRLFGCDAATFVPNYESSIALVHPDDRDSVIAAFTAALEEGDSYELEHRVLGADGVTRVLKECGDIERDSSGAPVRVVGSVFNVTQQRAAEAALRSSEEQLRQAQKMEAIGQLAGGVAHDFNNLLTVIGGYSDFLLNRTAPDDPVRGFVSEIKSAGERAAGLTRQLLAFSRQTVLEPKVLDLNVVVAGIERMLRRLIGEDVRLTTILDPGVGMVRVDPGQLEQIIMNLVVNARDAMPRGGRLTIETRSAELTEEYCRGRVDASPGHYVLVAVSDTGTGMTADIQARIFEPFFTTKGIGRGTGLGLSTVYGIVKQSEGHISVYSEVGLGTTFKVYFPRVDTGVLSADEQEALLSRHGTETILLVEDEASVRSIARLALGQFGYTVLEAPDGREALALAGHHVGAIDLLITDVVMPEVGGRQLAEALVVERPSTKVLYVSGYTDDAIVRHGILHAEVAFLQKPFSPDALLRKVREVLDNRGKSDPTGG
jgi:two-component system cell cycle sensor histidine kinase/response regulator CckA